MYDKSKALAAANRKPGIIAGINEDIKVSSAKVQTSPTGLTFLEITFEKDGQEVKHTEWKPSKAPWMTSDEQVEEAENRQYARMLQILTCFYKDEELNFVGESFTEFAKWVADLINNTDKDSYVRVKFVYNKKGFLSLPNTSTNTNKFIESMKVEKDKTELYIGAKDTIVRPITADIEKPTDPFKDDDPQVESDLPF